MTVSLQGLQVECVGMPMHLVNKMGEPDSQDERFVDVFDGGILLTRQAADPLACQFLWSLHLDALLMSLSVACF